MPVADPIGAKLTVENPDWPQDVVGKPARGGWVMQPLTVSERELAYSDDDWQKIKSLYVDGLMIHIRRQVSEWYEAQREEFTRLSGEES